MHYLEGAVAGAVAGAVVAFIYASKIKAEVAKLLADAKKVL